MWFKMGEIVITVPEGIPLSLLKRKIKELVKEEEIKWALFEKCKDELLLDKTDLDELEKLRDKAWRETRKKYAL